MAQGLLAKLGLQPVLANQYDAGIAEGAVISRNPPSASASSACKGDVEIVVSLGPIPTLTPRPATATPLPTDTPAATATPAETPTPLPSPTPSNRIFYDNFADGVKPEWNFSGGDVRTVNDELVIKGAAETALNLDSLTDFSIEFGKVLWGEQTVRLRIREQDSDNYVLAQLWDCFCWPNRIPG